MHRKTTAALTCILATTSIITGMLTTPLHAVTTELARAELAQQATIDGFDLVPAESAAVVLIPKLNRASAELEQLLQGMERGHLLMGARPMDQLRALLGLQSGVNEAGAGAIFLVDAQDEQPIFLIPVTDAGEFLAANFDSAPDGPEHAHIHASGNVMFAKTTDTHVAISENQSAIDNLNPAAGLAATIATEMGERGAQVLQRGDVLFYADQSMLKQLAADAVAQRNQLAGGNAPGFAEPLQSIAPPEILESAQTAIAAINFDPLGIGFNAFLKIDPETELGKNSQGGSSTAAAMNRLPAKPFYFAASLDLDGLGSSAYLDMLAADNFVLPSWVSDVSSLQFQMSPSVLGLQGGLFNESILSIKTDNPAALRDAMNQQLTAADLDNERFTTMQQWTEDLREIEGVSVAGYELKATPVENDPTIQMGQSLLFGPRGMNGFVGMLDDGVIVTFSQRPDVFKSAHGAATGNAENLAEDPVLKQMRTWLPPDADVEWYVGVGQFGKLLSQLSRTFPVIDASMLPQIDPATKPMGFGMEVDGGIVEFASVVPADVAVLFVDAIADGLMQVDGAGE